MSIYTPPDVLDTADTVPCYVLQFSERTFERLHEWVLRRAKQEAEEAGVDVDGSKRERFSEIVKALTDRIFMQLVEISQRSPIFGSPSEEEIKEVLDGLIGEIWYGYFTEDRLEEGTAFANDIEGSHKELIASM